MTFYKRTSFLQIIYRLIGLLISLVILGLVLWFLPAPVSWRQANTWQILAFFLPLLGIFISLLDTFVHQLKFSFLIGLALMFLVVLQALQSLNIFSLLITIVFTASLIFLLIKIKLPALKAKKLTTEPEIPKLRNISQSGQERKKQNG